MDQERLWNLSFLGLGTSNALFYMTQYMLIATLPIVILMWGGSAIEAGLAMTWFQVGTIIMRPLAGKIMNSFDKRWVLLGSTILFLLIMSAFNWVRSMELIYFLRGLHGMIFALGTTITAAIAVMVIPKKRRGEGISMFAVFSNVAMVVGPALGLFVLNSQGDIGLFILLTGIALACLVTANCKRLSKEVAKPVRHKGSQWSIDQFIEWRSLPWMFMALLLGFVYSGVIVFVPILLSQMNQAMWGSAFFGLYALAIVISRPFAGPAYTKFGPEALIYPGLVLFGIGVALLAFQSSYIMILIAAPILGLGYGSVMPAFQALAVQVAPIERAGVSTATFFLGMDISIGVGATILSVIVNAMGFSPMYGICLAVVLIMLLLYHFVTRRYSEPYENIQ